MLKTAMESHDIQFKMKFSEDKEQEVKLSFLAGNPYSSIINIENNIVAGSKTYISGEILDKYNNKVANKQMEVYVGNELTKIQTNNKGEFGSNIKVPTQLIQDEGVIYKAPLYIKYNDETVYSGNMPIKPDTAAKLNLNKVSNDIELGQGIVSGEVRDKYDNLCMPTEIKIKSDSDKLINSIQSDMDGKFNVKLNVYGVEPLIFIKDIEYSNELNDLSNLELDENFELDMNIEKDVVNVGDIFTVSGTVKDKDGEPFENKSITISFGDKYINTITNEKGEFTELLQAPKKIDQNHSYFNILDCSIKDKEGKDIISHAVKIIPKQASYLKLNELEELVKGNSKIKLNIEGESFDKYNNKAGESSVWMSTDEKSPLNDIISDNSGNFKFSLELYENRKSSKNKHANIDGDNNSTGNGSGSNGGETDNGNNGNDSGSNL